MSILTGGRPLLKIVPQGPADMQSLEVWQHALWSLVKTERVIEKWTEALIWALTMDGGWIKVGYGARDVLQERTDVLIASPSPKNILPDPDCTDISLSECSYVVYSDKTHLQDIVRRYPTYGPLVTIDGESRRGTTARDNVSSISPGDGWSKPTGYDDKKVEMLECWIDDSTLQHKKERRVVDYEVMPDTGILQPIEREVHLWEPKYPYGRVITCTRDVVLRDIPNPYGSAWGHAMRYPFVFVPGAEAANTLWRPGLASDMVELGSAINKALSLLLENFQKVTNAIVIADESAMEDYEWNALALYPGAKIRKARGTDVRVEFPKPLPAEALGFPDALIRKMEEVVGLHDPPINPGQAVAAKTVNFMQQKGHFLVGEMAKLAESSLERVGSRIVGLQKNRYITGRKIPMFTNDNLQQDPHVWPELPDSLTVRVEASSGWSEVMAAAMAAGQQQDKVGHKK